MFEFPKALLKKNDSNPTLLCQTQCLIFKSVIDVSSDGCHWQWRETLEDATVPPCLQLRRKYWEQSSENCRNFMDKEVWTLPSQNLAVWGALEVSLNLWENRSIKISRDKGKRTHISHVLRHKSEQVLKMSTAIFCAGPWPASSRSRGFLPQSALHYQQKKYSVLFINCLSSKVLAAHTFFSPSPQLLIIKCGSFWKSVVTCK